MMLVCVHFVETDLNRNSERKSTIIKTVRLNQSCTCKFSSTNIFGVALFKFKCILNSNN